MGLSMFGVSPSRMGNNYPQLTKLSVYDDIEEMKLITNWIVTSLIIFIVAYLLKGVHVDTIWTAFVIAVVMGLLNSFVRPLLVLLTLPITVVTLGLFLFVINAFLVIIADKLIPGFAVASFWWALLFSILVSALKLLIIKEKKK